MKEHAIHIENISTFRNQAGLPEFDITMSALANDERLDKVAYKKWLWEQIRERKGRQWAALGIMARRNLTEEIVLLSFEDGPAYMQVIISAIRFAQNERFKTAYEGLPEVAGP